MVTRGRVARALVACAYAACRACAGARVGPVRGAAATEATMARRGMGTMADADADATRADANANASRGATRAWIDPLRIERLSWRPHAEVFRGFLSPEECDHIMALAEEDLRPSTVVDASTGGSTPSEIRTSSGMFLTRGENDIVSGIEARIATWTKIPESHGEGFQVLRYNDGQEYRSHFDYFHDKFNTKREKGGQRVATVLMYLTDVESGGETVFPAFEEGEPAGLEASACARGKLAVTPRKGDALFFRSLHHNCSMDPLSQHAGCPVLRGVKFSATKWMHVSPIVDGSNGVVFPPGVCKDTNPNCAGWAKSGECERNPRFMIGRGRAKGNCMRSCDACAPGTRDE